jgi:hypothetical protein
MPKTGTITVAGGTSDITKAVAQSDPLITNIGTVAVSALKAFPVSGGAVIGLNGRVCKVLTAVQTADLIAAADDASNSNSINFTFLNGAKNNAPMGTSGGEAGALKDALEALVAQTRPSFSVQSILGKIEDTVNEQGTSALLIVDQASGEIRVYPGNAGAVENLEALAPADANVPAAFTQDVTTSPGRDFGE